MDALNMYFLLKSGDIPAIAMLGHQRVYGGFLKWWYPTTMGFPTKNDHFGVFWGEHHLRKHPYIRGLVTLNHCPSSTKRVWGVVFISFWHPHLQEDGVSLMPWWFSRKWWISPTPFCWDLTHLPWRWEVTTANQHGMKVKQTVGCD